MRDGLIGRPRGWRCRPCRRRCSSTASVSCFAWTNNGCRLPTPAHSTFDRACSPPTRSVRVKPAERFLFVIFTFPFASYYSGPVDVLVTEQYVRAFPGGTGDVKSAGNYAASLLADQEARAAGFATVLWLDGRERRFIEECGVMNVFFVLEDRVVTPSLSGTIIPGITRDSVITLLRDMRVEVEERRVSVQEIIESHRVGRLRECFGTGTAATVSHIKRLHYKGQDIALPPVASRKIGPLVHERLVAMVTGSIPDDHNWIERV